MQSLLEYLKFCIEWAHVMNKEKKTYSSPRVIVYKRESDIGKKPIRNIVLAVLLCCCFVALGFVAGVGYEKIKRQNAISDYEFLYEIGEFIQKNYYKEVDMDKLMEGAARGMLESLDNYSTIYEESPSSGKGAIGINISYNVCGEFRIEHVLPGSPAEEGGLESGDFIYSVNGKKVEGDFVATFNALMNPAKKIGERIVLRVRKVRGGAISDDIEIRTRELEDKYVFYRNDFSDFTIPVSDGVGYIKLTSFSMGAVSQMREAISEFNAKGKNKLILDLRGNLGGDGEILRQIAGFFLDDEQHSDSIPIIKLVDKKGAERWYKTSKNEYIFKDREGEIVVLVNANSASASEALLGAMLTCKTCEVVGSRTYGKGVAQSIVNFPDNYDPMFKIKITTGKYYFAGDISAYVTGATQAVYTIHGTGFTPIGDNLVLQRGGNHLSEDAQFLRALELLN